MKSRKAAWNGAQGRSTLFALALTLRRTCARLCHQAAGELEQIQFLLGHVSVQTTERYLGCKRWLRNAANDHIGLSLNGGGLIQRWVPVPLRPCVRVAAGFRKWLAGQASLPSEASRVSQEYPNTRPELQPSIWPIAHLRGPRRRKHGTVSHLNSK